MLLCPAHSLRDTELREEWEEFCEGVPSAAEVIPVAMGRTITVQHAAGEIWEVGDLFLCLYGGCC